jgi:hypothetical protein
MDLNTNAFRVVRSLTEGKKESPRTTIARSAGKAGGPARAARLSAEQRRMIAVKASGARWHKEVV